LNSVKKKETLMAQTIYHPSLEGAQHGTKSLGEFLAFAKKSGATGAQPSNFHVTKDGKLMSAKEIKDAFEKASLSLDGISMHCPFWVHTTAWTGSPSIRPFISADVAKKSPEQIEKWTKDYLFALFDLTVELKAKIIPMFWGVAFGWELATGYPWGFWKGGKTEDGTAFDLIKKGQDRFMEKTAELRMRANALGLYLAHEIHPGTAAMCADDFNMLVKICDGDKCLTVNADPSHCWENEGWEARFRKVADRVVACHVKNYVIRKGLPLRSMEPGWPGRAMQFTDLVTGDINLARYVEMLVDIGYPKRFCEIMGKPTAPLVIEAESAYRDLDACSANGIAFVRDNLCFPLAAGSFEEAMGEQKAKVAPAPEPTAPPPTEKELTEAGRALACE
jgi:sugar phosphate isomerase/epimerase